MNPEQNVKPEAEQLLKLLDMQLAAARERRNAKGNSRSHAGIIGLAVILGGAALALWMLMFMLEEMRPEKPAGEAQSAAVAK
jgi:hypothetical protein